MMSAAQSDVSIKSVTFVIAQRMTSIFGLPVTQRMTYVAQNEKLVAQWVTQLVVLKVKTGQMTVNFFGQL